MKTQLFPCLILAASVCLSGCQKQTTPTANVSAEKTSFQEVTAQLDPGGNLYCYLSTEQCLEGLAAKVSGLRGLVSSLPNLKDADRENVTRVLFTVTNLIKDSGLEDISGLGMSSIAVEKGVYHTKTLVHHYQGQGNGFAWTLFGQKPHGLAGLELLSTNTVVASFSDLDAALLWSVLEKEAAKSGFPQAEEMLRQLPETFEKATGLKWDKVLASLGAEYGFVLTLDESKKLTIPVPGSDQACELPEPGLMLVAKVKDDTIFSRIDAALTNSPLPVMKSDKPDRKLRTVQVPLPIPIQLRPTVASSGGYLFLATSDTLIEEALAVKAGQKPGLKSTEEFRHIARGIPQEGNNFVYLSPRLGRDLLQLQRQVLQLAAKATPEQSKWLQSIASSTNSAFVYAVGANTAEGWLMVGNGNQHPVKLLALSAVVPAAVGSAVALPAFAKARAAARKHSTEP